MDAFKHSNSLLYTLGKLSRRDGILDLTKRTAVHISALTSPCRLCSNKKGIRWEWGLRLIERTAAGFKTLTVPVTLCGNTNPARMKMILD